MKFTIATRVGKDNRIKVELQGKCPHCQSSIVFSLPLELGSIGSCIGCGRRYAIHPPRVFEDGSGAEV